MVDFSKAPKGATHWCSNSGHWYRTDAGVIMVWGPLHEQWYPSKVTKSLENLTKVPFKC